MTPEELRAACEARGIPMRRFADGRVQCLDPSQLPGAVRAHLRQDGHVRGQAEAAPEPMPDAAATEMPTEDAPTPRRSMRR